MLTEQNLNRKIYYFILQFFIRTGSSPSIPAITAKFKITEPIELDGYLSMLEKEGSIYRDSTTGDILAAYPFSATPTTHRVFFGESQQVYAMCAIDALGIPFMLNTDASISSTCAHCGRDMSVSIAGGKIATNSDEMVVVYTAPQTKCCAATEQCPFINFFCSPVHAQVWQSSYPHLKMETITLLEAVKRSKAGFGNLIIHENQLRR